MLNTIVELNKVSGKVKFSPFRSSVYKYYNYFPKGQKPF